VLRLSIKRAIFEHFTKDGAGSEVVLHAGDMTRDQIAAATDEVASRLNAIKHRDGLADDRTAPPHELVSRSSRCRIPRRKPDGNPAPTGHISCDSAGWRLLWHR
jgi:hypothetical protein